MSSDREATPETEGVEAERSPGLTAPGVLLVGLALSVGWGMRGNFGHEYGAMMPGALAGLAIAIASGREDWLRRAPWFGFLGAVGWSFGGSQSYMQVIGYTHSGDSLSVAYGFACLTLIGLLWACFGGAFTALAAVLDRKRLVSVAAAGVVVIIAWQLQELAISMRGRPDGDHRHEDILYWFDTDWVGASTAFAAVALYSLIRRRLEFGSSLVLHMAAGWWVGFLLLVVALGFRMTPPRGDNWAGCLGMFLGLLVFLFREKQTAAAWVAVNTGVWGGAAFALASTIKLLGMTSGVKANWHSILEQTYGFLNGIAIAVPMSALAARSRPADAESAASSSSTPDLFALWFTIVAVPYVNLIKNVDRWISSKSIPGEMLGLSSYWWYAAFFGAWSISLAALARRHGRRPLAFLPASPLGRSQWLFFILVWTLVVGNFERALVGFTSGRLVTEGVVALNALFCTLLVAILDRPARLPDEAAPKLHSRYLALTTIASISLVLINIGADWYVTRAVYGDTQAGHASLHIRFGPRATVKPSPIPGRIHP
ncbi:MAG: hypothetical protein SFX72_12380 [Isosphaeraceae bacterium]|nr:hypothetical protein [Isosphaeraceae bacterium]